MNPLEARRHFEQLIAYGSGLLEAATALNKQAQAAFDAELQELFRSRFGKRRKYSITRLREACGDQVQTCFQRHKAVRDAQIHAAGADFGSLRFLKAEQARVGALAEIRPGPEFLLWESVQESSYSSMGWGAAKYARNAAESYKLQAEAAGLEAEVVAETTKYPGGASGTEFSLTAYHVRVKAAGPTDLALLRYHRGLPFRELVRHYLRRGSNPRVYFPWLPLGYEAQVGLDAFGNDLPSTCRKAA